MSFVNRFAYVSIASHGLEFVSAARRSQKLLKGRGLDAVISDSMVVRTCLSVYGSSEAYCQVSIMVFCGSLFVGAVTIFLVAGIQLSRAQVLVDWQVRYQFFDQNQVLV